LSISQHLNVLLLQYKPCDNINKNIEKIKILLNNASVIKNTLVVCPELSIQKYICIIKDKNLFSQALDIDSQIFDDLRNISKNYKIFLCITVFMKVKNSYFNTAMIFDPSGKIIKKYNKKHIPSEYCYQEKYYFDQPKNNFKYFKIKNFKIGILICWDQWHQRSYEYMKKNNVNLIICPTAIGYGKVKNKSISLLNERKKWVNVISANSLMINTPIVISNRTGKETMKDSSISFWGSSFISDSNGDVVKRCPQGEGFIHHKFLIKDQITAKRMWNFVE
tara:strand:- start:48 stop:881 length:834 start_codon:yes stop_codon:yes gene_type:complete